VTLADKSRAIEALLCAGCDANGVSLLTASSDDVDAWMLAHSALVGSYRIHPVGRVQFNERLLLTAYRLIESSPTLRRDWFGAR
jgi:hypothetical protein